MATRGRRSANAGDIVRLLRTPYPPTPSTSSLPLSPVRAPVGRQLTSSCLRLAALAVALGALAAVAVVRLRSSASWERSTKLYGSGFRPYQGQMLFTLNDFKTGRVSFPSQNLANGQGVPEPVSPGGPEHSHVLRNVRKIRRNKWIVCNLTQINGGE